jgi:enoyl-CoA hydratase/carnithine racemase
MDTESEIPVLSELQDGVLTVTLNRPDDHNRMDRATMAAIACAMDKADNNEDVRVIVITGQGDYFCAGGRVDGHPNGTLKQRLDYAQAFSSMQDRLTRVGVPIIARVNGHCIAGGMSLLSFCDIAFAVDSADFGYPEVNYGQFPALALAVLVPMVPSKQAFDLLYSGRRFDAAAALEMRLINRAVPAGDLDRTVQEYATMLKTKDRNAVGLGRRAYHAMVPMTPASRQKYAQTFLITLLHATSGAVPHSSEDSRIAEEHRWPRDVR